MTGWTIGSTRGSHVLYVRGRQTTLPDPEDCVVIAGARSATAYGTQLAADLAATCVNAGKVVVSGLAYGIDSAAHRGALAVAPRSTIAVLASGVEPHSVIYPSAHQPLAQSILDADGWLVSEYPAGTRSSRQRFLDRNHLMARMARHVIIVEAAPWGGSMHMAKMAIIEW